MAAEQDHQILATLIDYAWAIILLVVGGCARWIYGHEQRVTRLEAHSEECIRARERSDEALHEVRAELKGVSSKIDRVLGALGARTGGDGGQ